METKKKKIIIGSIIAIAVILVGTLAILIFNNIKKEKELQEAIKLEQEQAEKEERELREQEEKERQDRLAKLEEGWNDLGDNQQYLNLGSQHLKRTTNGDEVTFEYDLDFIDSFYMINDGWFQGCSKEELAKILSVALVDLPDNATGKEVYDALCDYSESINRDVAITGKGTDIMQDFAEFEPEPTQNNQTSNQSSNKNNGTSGNSSNNSSNSNNSTGNNNSSSDDNQEDNSDEIDLPPGVSGAPEGDPADNQDPNDYGSIFG